MRLRGKDQRPASPLGVQHFVQRAGFGVGDRHDPLAPCDLRKGVEGVGRAGDLDLGVVPAVADHDDAPRQVQRMDGGGLAVVVRQGIGVVDARDPPLGVIDQVVAQDAVGRHAQFLGHRRDHVAEAAGDDQDLGGVLLEEVQIAPNRRRQPIRGGRGKGLHMVAVERQKRQTLAQRLAEIQRPGHRLVRQRRDLGADRIGVRRPGQGDVGQGLERLEIDQGRIEVEDQCGACRHGPRLSGLRARSIAKPC